MQHPSLYEDLARQHHQELLREARRHALASLHPRERRNPLSRLARLFERAPRVEAEPDAERTFVVARSGAG